MRKYEDDYQYSNTPQAKYDKANTTFISLRIDKKADADILAALEGKAKQTEVKRLVRLGLEKLRRNEAAEKFSDEANIVDEGKTR